MSFLSTNQTILTPSKQTTLEKVEGKEGFEYHEKSLLFSPKVFCWVSVNDLVFPTYVMFLTVLRDKYRIGTNFHRFTMKCYIQNYVYILMEGSLPFDGSNKSRNTWPDVDCIRHAYFGNGAKKC